jgi:hypothetical protein
MGFIVGSIFGGLLGGYSAILYRSFFYIPLSAIVSGGSFGFFMGIGMVMRSEMEGTEETTSCNVIEINPETGSATSEYVFERHIVSTV